MSKFIKISREQDAVINSIIERNNGFERRMCLGAEDSEKLRAIALTLGASSNWLIKRARKLRGCRLMTHRSRKDGTVNGGVNFCPECGTPLFKLRKVSNVEVKFCPGCGKAQA